MLRFAPIDPTAHFDPYFEFLRDAFIGSYGDADRLEELGGREGCRAGLEEMLATFPEGAVHVWENGRLVGQVELRIRGEPPPLGIVNLFYLIPEARGRGLGPQLHAYACDVFRRHGVSKARLSVAPANTRAVRFYTRLGWRDLGPRPDRPYVHAMEIDLV